MVKDRKMQKAVGLGILIAVGGPIVLLILVLISLSVGTFVDDLFVPETRGEGFTNTSQGMLGGFVGTLFFIASLFGLGFGIAGALEAYEKAKRDEEIRAEKERLANASPREREVARLVARDVERARERSSWRFY